MTVQEQTIEAILFSKLEISLLEFQAENSGRKWRALEGSDIEEMIEKACEELPHQQRIELAANLGVDATTPGWWYHTIVDFHRLYRQLNPAVIKTAA